MLNNIKCKCNSRVTGNIRRVTNEDAKINRIL